MSGKLFIQIVLLIIIAAIVLFATKYAMKSYVHEGGLKSWKGWKSICAPSHMPQK